MENTKNTKAEMEDDEDLEMLRLAALKSLKKENVPAVKSVSKIEESHVIPVVSNIRPAIDKYYAPGEPEMVQPNLIHHPVPPYVSSGFEKMDINDTYIPQRLNPPPVAPFNEYVPYVAAPVAGGILEPTTNVQLSPRSAAFVYENKQIIKRRQGISPAHSPVPFRQASPGRWSRSPSPEAWKYRRSKSRSPAYPNHSPHYRNRSMSRSPQRRRHSPPQPVHSRRNRSRSPIPRNNFDGNAHRSDRRSPVSNRRGNNSPTNRHAPRPWRGHSPTRDNGVHARKSGSPRIIDDLNHRRRRTRSPNTNAKPEVRRRTSSRSPNRKNPRTNLGRPRRSPPHKRFNNSNGNNKPGHSGIRNRNNHSAQNHRSHSPQNHHKRRSPARNTMENGECTNKHAEKESTSDRNEKPMAENLVDKSMENESNENAAKDKTEQEMEDELLASSDSENSDNDNSDGIDLFASEESESENEGRFKLTSSKSERKTVPTVSFSELGKKATAPADVLMRDLDEMQTDSVNSNRRGGGRRDMRNRRDDRRFNRDRDRENRDRDRDRNRIRDRDGDRERDRDRDNNRIRGRERESSKPRSESTNTKNDRKANVSKSTIDVETRTKTPEADKHVDVKSKVSGEKRSAVKRSNKSSEQNADTKNLQSTVIGSTTTSEKRASPNSESAAASAKKPIHLRLGAMTKTWKTSKKTWRTEKV